MHLSKVKVFNAENSHQNVYTVYLMIYFIYALFYSILTHALMLKHINVNAIFMRDSFADHLLDQ